MPFSDVVQLELPAPFPLDEFEGFWYEARTVLPRLSAERREFNAGASLVAYRFRNCVQYQGEFLQSWKAVGAAAPFEELYARERAFFGMFVCGVSCIESACYANYALGAVTLGLAFAEKARIHATPRRLLKSLRQKIPKAPLVVALSEMLRSPEWKLWTDYRNTMTHRSTVPRVIYGSTGILPPANILEYGETWSTAALSGDEGALSNQITWIADATRKILGGGIALARQV